MSKVTKTVLTLKGGKNKGITVEYPKLRTAVLTLRAINHPVRKQIIELIDDKKEITVTDIYVNLNLDQSVVSQHLAALRRANIVNTLRNGKYIRYSLNHNRIGEVNNLVDSLAQKK